MSLYDIIIFKDGSFTINLAQVAHIIVLWIGANLLLFFLKRIILKRIVYKGVDVSRKHSIILLFKYLVFTIAFFLSLNFLNINITFLIASSAALLVGLGLGLQQTFNDMVSGIILLIEGSVRVGDVMEVDGLVGRVFDINLRTSKILTRDGIYIIVPNSKFINSNVINWSHQHQENRFSVEVGVAYSADVKLVEQVLVSVAMANKDVNSSAERKPIARIKNFGDSSIDFELLFWSSNIFYIEFTKSEIRFEIVNAFRKNNITIPFPQRDLHHITK